MDRVGELWSKLGATAATEAPFRPLPPATLGRLEERLTLPPAWRERLAAGYPSEDLPLFGKLGRMRLPSPETLLEELDDRWATSWLPLDISDGHLCLTLDLEDEEGALWIVNREDGPDEAGLHRRERAETYGLPNTVTELLEASVVLRGLAPELDWLTVRDEEVLSATSERRLEAVLAEHPSVAAAITAKTRAALAKEWKTERALAALIVPVPLFLADAAHSFVTQLWQGSLRVLMLVLIGGLPAALAIYIVVRIVALTRALAALERSPTG